MLNRFLGFLSIVSIVIITSCTSTTGLNMQPEEYFMPKHNPDNNLVYFFIERNNSSKESYAFFITDQMTIDEVTNVLMEFTAEGKAFPTQWYNKYYPVVIQDDNDAITMAAFSFPKNTKKIFILGQLVSINGNIINNQMFPLDFEISNAPIQYCLIRCDEDHINVITIEEAEKDRYLNRTTNYGTQLGRSVQSGFIVGP